MNIKVQISYRNILYNSPVSVFNHKISENKVLSANIFLNQKHIGHLDFVSLPFFHVYNINQWGSFLQFFLEQHDFTFHQINLTKPFFNTIKPIDQLPGEFLFVIESILFLIIEKCYPDSLAIKLPKTLKINSLFLDKENIPNCLKLKIRPTKKNLEETIETFQFLFNNHSQCKIRLDGNHTFTLNTLEDYLNSLALINPIFLKMIEYIEEPFAHFYDSFLFLKNHFLQLAIDESLEFYKNDLNKLPKDFIYILKPSLLGLSKSFEMVYAFEHKCIISSSYEPSTSLKAHFYLAALNPQTHHGLDTLKYLPNDLSIISENLTLTF